MIGLNTKASTSSSSSLISLGGLSQSSHEDANDDYLGVLSAPSSAAASLGAGRELSVTDEDSWEREREQVWNQEKERRLRDVNWQASLCTLRQGSDKLSGERQHRTSSRKPPVPVTRGPIKSTRVEPTYEENEDFEGRMTVESRVQRKWARWLCCSFAANAKPHWCSDQATPELPLPESVTNSVLMALILGQLLPPSALPPSLVVLMTSRKGKRQEQWVAGKAQGAGERTASSIRRILDDSLRILQTRSDGTKTLPGTFSVQIPCLTPQKSCSCISFLGHMRL